MRAPDFTASRIACDLDLTAPGKRWGALRLKWSSDDNPLGHHPIPIMVAVGAPGPTALLLGGVHGDEYEGPAALQRLWREIEPGALTGRVLFLPALNAPAVRGAARCSPLDGGNLNRAFPGTRDGGPTAMIAHMVERCLLPVADAAIDLHSGGKASWFVPCALAARRPDGGLDPANMALAEAFGAGLIWVLGGQNDDRSVNAAATRAGVACIAAELGGGGALGAGPLAAAERGLRRCLGHLGLIADASGPAAPSRRVELATGAQSVAADAAGYWRPAVAAGAEVAAGALLGEILDIDRPESVAPARAPCAGLVLAESRRGLVRPGDFLALVASDVTCAPPAR